MKEPPHQKHLLILNHILVAIRSGRLRPGDKAPSEYSLAQRFKINKTTCNKAVSMLVADGYLERRKGSGTYVVDEFAKVAPMIGVMINISPGSFFSHMLVGIQEEAASRGYGVLLFQTSHRERDMEKFRKYVMSTGIRGVVINRPFIQPLEGIRNLYLNTAIPNPDVDQIQTDDFHGGYLVGRHFIECGHTHSAFISQDVSRDDLVARARGFKKAMDEECLNEISAKLHSISRREHNLFSVLQRLLRSDHRITAIAFDSIHIASEGYQVLRRLKYQVPQDISIAGFGNLLAGEQTMRLATVDQHPLVLGHTAATSLIDLIEGRVNSRIDITVPVELIRGDSVAVLKKE